jgi:hypothetical protein
MMMRGRVVAAAGVAAQLRMPSHLLRGQYRRRRQMIEGRGGDEKSGQRRSIISRAISCEMRV